MRKPNKLMSELIYRFKDFFESEVLRQRFDYVVPIETKGMLLLDEIIRAGAVQHPKVLCRRAFDFLAPEALARARIALLDDSVFRGSTLNNSADALKIRGAKDVERFAFILYEDAETLQDRKIDGVKYCERLTNSEFTFLLDDLSQLSLRSRPSNPDHLIYSGLLTTPVSPETVLNDCCQLGTLAEYRRSPQVTTWSIHYPLYNSQVEVPFARDVGPNKLRISMPLDGMWIRFSPGFFPALTVSPADRVTDTIWQSCLKVMERDWQDPDTHTRNFYESFTLALRAYSASTFVAFVEDQGLRFSKIELETDRFEYYYGETVAKRLKDLCLETVLTRKKARFFTGRDNSLADDGGEIPIPTGLIALMNALEAEYKTRNAHKQTRYDWVSAGLDIDNLARRTGYSRAATSIGMEILNDYGYSVPLLEEQSLNGARQYLRTYRLTESGTARLHS